MPIAFIMINVEAGAEKEVVRELRATEYVKYVYFVYGVYDIVAKVEALSQQKLKETITGKIRRIAKIRSTQTQLVSD